MLYISTIDSLSYQRPLSYSMTGRGKKRDSDSLELDSSERSVDVPKKISFPDPPRPPTPGPPPRPPPIPPRPPVPTPPPSPRSDVEEAWLQGLVATQLSILVDQLVNIWFALGVPVSLPYPDRPPTPGPRPGPVGPRPDVPTPPPSPRNAANCSTWERAETDMSCSRQLSYPQETLKERLGSPLKLTTSSLDSRQRMRTQRNRCYDDKLTDKSDIRHETRLHVLVYTTAPNGLSGPHTPNLGSYEVSESSRGNGSLVMGTGTLRNDPGLFWSSSPTKIVNVC